MVSNLLNWICAYGETACKPWRRFRGKPMEDTFRIQERRNSVRWKMIYPAIYARLDQEGRPFDQKPSRSIDVSLGGMRLQSIFPVQPREMLDIAVALGNSLINYKGEVVYVIHDQDQGFEMGISIREINKGDRLTLNRVKRQLWDSYDIEHDNLIIRRGRVVCPNCGEPIGSVDKIRAMIAYCKEFLGQCSCGLRYDIRVSSYGGASLSFPEKQIELVC